MRSLSSAEATAASRSVLASISATTRSTTWCSRERARPTASGSGLASTRSTARAASGAASTSTVAVSTRLRAPLVAVRVAEPTPARTIGSRIAVRDDGARGQEHEPPGRDAEPAGAQGDAR